MKKIYIILITIALFSFKANAQQLPYYSQYMFNPYLINPAAAGAAEHNQIAVGVKNQWIGLEGAPRTQMLSGNALIDKTSAVGGMLFSDKTGPLSKLGAQLSYAYHLPVTSGGAKLSLGLAGFIYQNVLDKTTLTTDQPGDLAIQNGNDRAISPDATFGMYFYNTKYYVGLSVPQLIESKLKYSGSGSETNKLNRHYFFTAGYRYGFKDHFVLEPSVLIKYVNAAPLQYDINTKLHYKDFLWAGVSYRNQESVIPMIGVNYNQISLGFAYDVTLTNIRTYSSGSMELFFAFNFARKKKDTTPVIEVGKEEEKTQPLDKGE
jgi:type IX secretion system PorP/SprF family membrane protein